MKNLLPKKTQVHTFYITSRFFDPIAYFLSGLSLIGDGHWQSYDLDMMVNMTLFLRCLFAVRVARARHYKRDSERMLF